MKNLLFTSLALAATCALYCGGFATTDSLFGYAPLIASITASGYFWAKSCPIIAIVDQGWIVNFIMFFLIFSTMAGLFMPEKIGFSALVAGIGATCYLFGWIAELTSSSTSE